MKKAVFAAFLSLCTGIAAPNAVARSVVQLPAEKVSSVAKASPVTVAIEVSSSGKRLWAGSLRVGPQHGNARFNTSKSEYADPCPGEPADRSRSSSSENLRVGLSRQNWMQEPDRFNVTVNLTQPAPACQGGGNDTVGFTRFVTLGPGGSATIEGEGGLVVRVSRQR